MMIAKLDKIKITLKNHWRGILLIITLWFILNKYGHLLKSILEASQLASCISSDESTMQPCGFLLNLAGQLIFWFGLINIIFLTFKENKDDKETIIKMLFVYFSAVVVLYSSGIGYTDIEQQKLQLKLNQEYHTAKQEIELLHMYKNHQEIIKNNQEEKEKIFENSLKIKGLELSISNRDIFYKVQQEEAKLYLQYRVTASFAIIVMSYVLLLVVLLQLNIDKLKIALLLIALLLFNYPTI